MVTLGKFIRENARNPFERNKMEENCRILVQRVLTEEELLNLYNDHLTRQGKWKIEAEVSPIEPIYYTELLPSLLGNRLKKKYALDYERKYVLNQQGNQEEGEGENEGEENAEVEQVGEKRGIKFNLEYWDELFRYYPFRLSGYDVLNTNVEKIVSHFILEQ